MSDFRDTHKTAGAIRGAAFYLCQMVRGTELHDAAAELHYSICKATPPNSETPAAVMRSAAELFNALSLATRLLEDLNCYMLNEDEDLHALAVIHNALEAAQGGACFCCTGCNRPEEECSADPCKPVQRERAA